MLLTPTGKDRLDFIGTMTTLILGHAPEPVVDAVKEQLEQGVVYNAPNRHQVRLAKLLCERIPSFELVRFTNSGTEATLNTIRAARAFTGRGLIAKAEGGYHGSHDVVSVSVRVDPSKAGERLHPDALAATEGLADGVLDSVVVIPFNEVGPAREILEQHKDDLAAVIVEPMLGSVGMLPATHEFLAMLREFATENGTVLIFDEVISFRDRARRVAGVLRDHSGHDLAGKDHRRRVCGRRLRWARGHHGAVRSDIGTKGGPRRHLQCQPGDHAGRGTYAGTADARSLPTVGGSHRVPASRAVGGRAGAGAAGADHRARVAVRDSTSPTRRWWDIGILRRRTRPSGTRYSWAC